MMTHDDMARFFLRLCALLFILAACHDVRMLFTAKSGALIVYMYANLIIDLAFARFFIRTSEEIP